MTGILQAILSFFGVAPAAAANYIEDVFSTYLYTGTGSSQTITNNIDTSTKGGLVWIKGRSGATGHRFTDTVRGATKSLESNSTAAEATESTGLTAFGTTGFTIGADADYNTNTATYASWTFRKQAKFFDVVTYTGNGANRTISHNLGSVPGCIIVKRTDTTAAWAVYHRSLANTEYLVLNTTAAKATGATYWNSTTPTSTVFSLGTSTDVNANGGTYVAYLFAHDAGGFGAAGTDNVISCGSYTGSGAGTTTVNLGFEPQFLLLKNTGASGGAWLVLDNMRGLNSLGGSYVYANTSDAEFSSGPYWGINSTGFFVTGGTVVNYSGENHIYIAIRRGPMKTPTSGTSVFSPIAYSGNSSTNSTVQNLTTGFAGDAAWITDRTSGSQNKQSFDKLRGSGVVLYQSSTTTEKDFNAAYSPASVSFNNTQTVLTGQYTNNGIYNQTGYTYISYNFQRAPGFFDVVCYTGTGANTTITHNLGATPELMIVKRRGTANAWAVYANNDNTDYLVLNTDAATVDDNTYWNDTSPTSSVFSVGTNNAVNASGSTYVAYLFASVTGVSKVGSYTGTGTTLQVDCGFTAGARFVMIKRTDSTGDWYIWDSARGIVAGNDPYLLLNSTAAEVTNTDYVDTSNAGFEISSTAPAAINASGGTFIFLAIA